MRQDTLRPLLELEEDNTELARPTTNPLAVLYQRYQKHLLQWNPDSRYQQIKFLTCMTSLFVLAMPDGLTYHAYAKTNGQRVFDYLETTSKNFAFLGKYWCEYGAPTGVYVFALNNLLRWAWMLNHLSMFKYYNNYRVNVGIFILSGLLSALSVVPFYGMAKDAHLNSFFIFANSFARFCMDHYAWNEVLGHLHERKPHTITASTGAGAIGFITGAITATYLYPFAEDVSNVPFAVLAVMPTCLLWGLDSKTSWHWVIEHLTSCRKKDNMSCYLDNDLSKLTYFLYGISFIIAAAGAFSETLMAHDNAQSMPYPTLLFVAAIIAFPAIYLTGFVQLIDRAMMSLQIRREDSPRTAQLLVAERHKLINQLQARLPDTQTTQITHLGAVNISLS